MEIYIIKDGTQQGPYTLEDLVDQAVALGLTPDTPVWYQGLGDWVALKDAEATAELAVILADQQTTPPSVPPQYGKTPPQPNPGSNDMPPMPDNYLVWAIISMVCCCLPFGIVSLVYSTQVSSKYYAGDYAGAVDSSNKAKNWALIALVVGIVSSLLWAFLQVSMGLFASIL